MRRMDGKLAVITGGANGIGRACCERFAVEGADIVFGDIADAAAARTVSAVEALGRRARYVRTDVSDPVAVDNLMQTAVDTFSRLDVLVTAAGVSYATYQSSGDAQQSLNRALADPENQRDPLKRYRDL